MPSDNLGTLVLWIALTMMVLLAAGAGLWALRRYRSRPGKFGNRPVPASTADRSDRGSITTARMQQVLPDPSFGGWPITGDFLLDAAVATRPGQ